MPIIAAELPLGVSKPRFRIFILGEKETFPVADYLEKLKQSNLKSHDRLWAMFKSSAEHGPNSFDVKRCRKIKGIKEDIYELKTNCGNRVLWFYDAGSIMLCADAFKKPGENELRQEARNSIDWYYRYLNAKKAKQLTFEYNEQNQ